MCLHTALALLAGGPCQLCEAEFAQAVILNTVIGNNKEQYLSADVHKQHVFGLLCKPTDHANLACEAGLADEGKFGSNAALLLTPTFVLLCRLTDLASFAFEASLGVTVTVIVVNVIHVSAAAVDLTSVSASLCRLTDLASFACEAGLADAVILNTVHGEIGSDGTLHGFFDKDVGTDIVITGSNWEATTLCNEKVRLALVTCFKLQSQPFKVRLALPTSISFELYKLVCKLCLSPSRSESSL